jgi:hypothetical protein
VRVTPVGNYTIYAEKSQNKSEGLPESVLRWAAGGMDQVPGVGVGEAGLGVVSGVGVGVATGVALGGAAGLGLVDGVGEAFGRRWGFFVGVAPAFSIVFPVFSIPFPTVRAVVCAPFFTVSPVAFTAFLIVFSVFWTGVGASALRAKGNASAAQRIRVNFIIRKVPGSL